MKMINMILLRLASVAALLFTNASVLVTAFIAAIPKPSCSTITIININNHNKNWRLYMNNNFMNRLPQESNDAYFRRVTSAASNPQSFESAVLHSSSQQEQQRNPTAQNSDNNQSDATASTTNATATGTSKYVRAEVWEEQEREKAKSSSNWEERVQFDGQIHGNRFNQNEILRHNLKGF